MWSLLLFFAGEKRGNFEKNPEVQEKNTEVQEKNPEVQEKHLKFSIF